MFLGFFGLAWVRKGVYTSYTFGLYFISRKKYRLDKAANYAALSSLYGRNYRKEYFLKFAAHSRKNYLPLVSNDTPLNSTTALSAFRCVMLTSTQ